MPAHPCAHTHIRELLWTVMSVHDSEPVQINSLDWRDCALTGGGAEDREGETTSDIEARLGELYSVLVNSSSRHAC